MQTRNVTYDAKLDRNDFLSYIKGKFERRMPMKKTIAGMALTICMTVVLVTSVAAQTPGLVPANRLANRKSLQKSATNAEFQQAYNTASLIVTPLVGLDRQTQVISIAQSVRALTDCGYVRYTTSVKHYNDPYGYFVVGVASCAGAARATGLCLNMLGIPYEHVHENQWSHQWCRVPMPDGTFWIVDPYGLYVGPEPAPYIHPYL